MVIPSNAVGRVLKQLNAIRDMSGVNIDVEKPEKKSSDRTIIIKYVGKKLQLIKF